MNNKLNTANLDKALRIERGAAGGAGGESTHPREPHQFLGRVRHRRWARRARAGGVLAVVAIVLGGAWLGTRGAAPARSRDNSPVIASNTPSGDLAAIPSAKDRPAGSGLQFSLVAHAGSRPGGDAWRALLED